MSLAIASARATALSAAGTQENPIFAWDNMAARASVITSNRPVFSDGALLNAVSGTTFDFWRPQDSASITSPTFQMDIGSAVAPDFFGLIGHNIKTVGVASVDIHSSPDAAAWTLVSTITVAGLNGVCDGLYIATPTARRYWRLTFNSLPALAKMQVAGIFMGPVLTSPQRVYQGYAPVITPTEVELQSNVSAGGNLLGSAIVKRGSRVSASLSHIPEATIRGAVWKGFQAHFNEGKPVIFAWRPTTYPDDLHLIWRDGGVIRPTNSGPRALMDVQIDARVFEG